MKPIAFLLLLVLSVAAQTICQTVLDPLKVDCGVPGINQQQCEANGCCWSPAPNGSSTPWCFYNSNGSPLSYSNVFGSNMVLQRDVTITLWGYVGGTAATDVTCTLGAATHSAATNLSTGTWSVDLPPQSYNASPQNVTCNNVTLTNVLIGDVIFCSGQSNMASGNTPVGYVYNATSEIADADRYPNIRILTVATIGGTPSPLPQLAGPPRIPWSVGPSAVSLQRATSRDVTHSRVDQVSRSA